MKKTLKETYERMFGPLAEAAKALQGYEKYVIKIKGKILFYAESPDGELFLGANQVKKNKYNVEVGFSFPPSGNQISAIENGIQVSKPAQVKSAIQNQMTLAKKGYVDPDGNKFSFKVHVNKLGI